MALNDDLNCNTESGTTSVISSTDLTTSTTYSQTFSTVVVGAETNKAVTDV